MAVTVITPTTRFGKAWGELAARSRIAGFVDQWWYEHAEAPCTVICSALEVAIGFVGIRLMHLPAVDVLNVGRASIYANEVHTFGLFLRHGNFDLFNRSQTWSRRPDGSIEQHPDAVRTALTSAPVTGTALERASLRMRRTAGDLVFQRRKMPAFVLGVASPALSFGLASALHLPLIAVIAITYTTQGLAMAPMVRSGCVGFWHFLTHIKADGARKAWKDGFEIFNRPQMVAPPDPVLGEPGAPEADEPAGPAVGVRPPASGPSGRRISPIQRVAAAPSGTPDGPAGSTTHRIPHRGEMTLG